MFELHENLKSKIFVIDLTLCTVLLEDNAFYPWIFLVPRRPLLSRLMDVASSDQLQLWRELEWAQKILYKEFESTQINVAALGNKTPQLHIHVIARSSGDPAWPNTIWDPPVNKPYTPEQKERTLSILKNSFEGFLCTPQ